MGVFIDGDVGLGAVGGEGRSGKDGDVSTGVNGFSVGGRKA